MAPRPIGRAIIALGGGRQQVDDSIDPAVGIVVSARPGDRVEKGQPLATIHARTTDDAARCADALAAAIAIGDGAVEATPLVSHRVTAAGVEEL